jgi:DNA-binding MarR family transcriptional regulator
MQQWPDAGTSAQAGEAAREYVFSQQVGHLLRRAYQRHVAVFQQEIPDSRLTGAQFCVMCALRDHGAISMSEIGRVTAIDQATVRGIVERLKARELVTTSADDVDTAEQVALLYLLRKLAGNEAEEPPDAGSDAREPEEPVNPPRRSAAPARPARARARTVRASARAERCLARTVQAPRRAMASALLATRAYFCSMSKRFASCRPRRGRPRNLSARLAGSPATWCRRRSRERSRWWCSRRAAASGRRAATARPPARCR